MSPLQSSQTPKVEVKGSNEVVLKRMLVIRQQAFRCALIAILLTDLIATRKTGRALKLYKELSERGTYMYLVPVIYCLGGSSYIFPDRIVTVVRYLSNTEIHSV